MTAQKDKVHWALGVLVRASPSLVQVAVSDTRHTNVMNINKLRYLKKIRLRHGKCARYTDMVAPTLR